MEIQVVSVAELFLVQEIITQQAKHHRDMALNSDMEHIHALAEAELVADGMAVEAQMEPQLNAKHHKAVVIWMVVLVVVDLSLIHI